MQYLHPKRCSAQPTDVSYVTSHNTVRTYHSPNEYLKPQNLTYLLAVINHCPQYRYTSCWTEKMENVTTQNPRQWLHNNLCFVKFHFWKEDLAFMYVCISSYHILKSVFFFYDSLIPRNCSVYVHVIFGYQFGGFMADNLLSNKKKIIIKYLKWKKSI